MSRLDCPTDLPYFKCDPHTMPCLRRQPGHQQGEVRPFEPVSGPSAWTAADYKGNEQWIYRLSDEDVKELERAVNGIIDKGVRVQVCMTGSTMG